MVSRLLIRRPWVRIPAGSSNKNPAESRRYVAENSTGFSLSGELFGLSSPECGSLSKNWENFMSFLLPHSLRCVGSGVQNRGRLDSAYLFAQGIPWPREAIIEGCRPRAGGTVATVFIFHDSSGGSLSDIKGPLCPKCVAFPCECPVTCNYHQRPDQSCTNCFSRANSLERYNAVYGAMVAQLMMTQETDFGVEESMRRIVKQAHEIAALSEKVQG